VTYRTSRNSHQELSIRHLAITICIIGLPLFSSARETIEGSITHDDLQRDYILYLPASYSGDLPVPLIFNFHGWGSNAADQMWYGDFRSVADTAGFLVIHPQGTVFDGYTHWNVGGWTVGSPADDVGFTDALIDSLSAEYNIDPLRIYATGMSNGGFMSFLLACQLSDRIAAIASVTGSMTPETYEECTPQHPTPILQMHGTVDTVVPYNGTAWSEPVNDVLEYWAEYNNCNPIPEITALPDIDPDDGSTIEHMVFYDGDNGVVVEHYMIVGGGHTWPGNAFGGQGTNYDVDASVDIWNFFSRYDINGLIESEDAREAAEVLPPGFDLAQNHPNPFNPTTTIEFTLPVQQEILLSVVNIQGQLIEEIVRGTYPAGAHTVRFDGSRLASGMYLYRLVAGEQLSTRKMILIK